MKKVCHISSAHKSSDARVFRRECVSLANAGYEVYLVIEGDSRVDQGVHIVGLGEQPQSRLKRMMKYTRKAYKAALSLDCDLYHIHDPELLPYAWKLRKKGKTVVFDSHENTLEQMEEKTWIPRLLRGIVSKCYRAYATRIFKGLSGLISVTPNIVDQLKAINPRTYMVTNYPILTDYEHREKKEEGVFRLCFTGGISPQWNHDVIINAINDMDNVQYDLCGKASESYLNTLKNCPGWDKVVFYGMIPFEKAAAIQRESDVGIALLSPSNNTAGMMGTIGNTKLFEYMMAGLPLICTNFELWKQIVEKYKCGICVPAGDIEALKKAIKTLMNNPKEMNQMGLNGRKAIEQEYNWSTQERILLDMYGELLTN